MSRPNLLALACVVAGIGFALWGLWAFSFPVVVGPEHTMAIIQETAPVGGLPQPPLLEPWIRGAPTLFWVVGTLLCAIPASLFIMVGVTVRLLIARPRELESIGYADTEADREEGLQWLIREWVESTTEDEASRTVRLYRAAAQVVPTLDPARGARLRLFLRETALEQQGFEASHSNRAEAPPPFTTKKLLARIAVVVLSALGLLALLWGVLSALFLQRVAEVIGWESHSPEPLMILLFAWLLAGLLLLTAVGVWYLSRLNRTIERHWVRGFAASCERLLLGFRACLESVGKLHGNDGPTASTLIRGLVLTALRGVDGGRKRALVEVALELGAIRPGIDLSGADLRQADLSGLDLSGLDLRATYLSGASLAETNLAGTTLDDCDLRSGDLRGANLRNASLRRANLQGGQLHRAFLARANLSDANLFGANLWQADFDQADLTRASVRPKQLLATRNPGNAPPHAPTPS